ncbi:hypothetical protein ABZW18_06695 [Streptomyces sp. NPDC004647]|uniref:hypothetical protein n=1 Tax=Streptomyces sp. NPDC004647 TaxID=3154671 RepID=UPI0033BC60A7
MSASYVIPVTVRGPRTVVARRALLVALFLGGLLGLAFLFGGSAHAAESDGSSHGGKLFAPAQHVREKAKEHLAEDPQRHSAKPEGQRKTVTAKDAVKESVRPIAGRTERLARPAGDLVEDTTGGPVRLPESSRDENSQRPETGRQGPGLQAPDTSAGAAKQTADSRADRATVLAADLSSQQHRAEQADADDAQQHRDRLPAHFPQAPAQSGSTSQNAGDSSGPRGGDSHATPVSDTPRYGLPAGAVREASSAPTRERSTEILEFPG